MAECRGSFITPHTYERGLRRRIQPGQLAVHTFCVVRFSLQNVDGGPTGGHAAAEFPVTPQRIAVRAAGGHALELCFVDEDFQPVFTRSTSTANGVIVPPIGVEVTDLSDGRRFEVDSGYFSTYKNSGAQEDLLREIGTSNQDFMRVPGVGELITVKA